MKPVKYMYISITIHFTYAWPSDFEEKNVTHFHF